MLSYAKTQHHDASGFLAYLVHDIGGQNGTVKKYRNLQPDDLNKSIRKELTILERLE